MATVIVPPGSVIVYTTDGSDPMDYILTNPEGLAIFNPDGELVTTGDVQ